MLTIREKREKINYNESESDDDFEDMLKDYNEHKTIQNGSEYRKRIFELNEKKICIICNKDNNLQVSHIKDKAVLEKEDEDCYPMDGAVIMCGSCNKDYSEKKITINIDGKIYRETSDTDHIKSWPSYIDLEKVEWHVQQYNLKLKKKKLMKDRESKRIVPPNTLCYAITKKGTSCTNHCKIGYSSCHKHL